MSEKVVNTTDGMKATDLLKAAIKDRKTNQVKLAEKLGVGQPAISGYLNSPRMGVDVFRKILNALNYDLVVVDRETGEIKWTVSE